MVHQGVTSRHSYASYFVYFAFNIFFFDFRCGLQIYSIKNGLPIATIKKIVDIPNASG